MAERHVLLVTYHFPPSAASGTFRMLGFARHLPKFDWQVSVVAPPELPWEPVDAGLSEKIPPETRIHAVPYPRRAPKLVRWAAPWGVWLPVAWRTCRRLFREQSIDAVLTSGPPHGVHVLGYYLKRKFGVPWLADFRDPWLTAGSNSAQRGMRGLWLKHWERRVFRNADVVLANAPNAAAAMQHSYPRWAGKVETLPNGFDPPFERAGIDCRTGFLARPTAWEGRPTCCQNVRRQIEPDGIHLVHAGELYAGRDPRPLLDAVAQWNRCAPQGRRMLSVHFVGKTSQCGFDLATEIKDRRLPEFVTLHGQIPYADAISMMQAADILVLLDSPGRTIGVPAKVYEYLGAGRPILAFAERESDTAQVLRQSGAAHCVISPASADNLLPALVELSERTASVEELRGRWRFTREHLAGELARIMERCVRQPLAV
ncbi:MAG: glycosyltransferase [Acidobacteria bacterium]|nr:glycosyltransferase [Acidobacteriota bacterium]MBI3406900.1 glycosyltransferase [Planctomycetota bacterium]